MHVKRRKNVLSKTKGMLWGRKSKLRLARVAELKAGSYAYRDRRNKKREFRRLWQVRINAGVRPHGLSYSKFMHALKEAGSQLDRKVLSELAKDHKLVFDVIVGQIKK